jgi:hypothetical protein
MRRLLGTGAACNRRRLNLLVQTPRVSRWYVVKCFRNFNMFSGSYAIFV